MRVSVLPILGAVVSGVVLTATPADPPQGAAAPRPRLAIAAFPSPAPCRAPDENVYVAIQVVDAQGVPLTSVGGTGPIVVNLATSDPQILEPYGDGGVVTIGRAALADAAAGRFVARGSKCGTAWITATASGLDPVSVSVTTVPRSGGGAIGIRLYSWPVRPTTATRSLEMLAQFVDADGLPALFPRHVPVKVQSSAPDIASSGDSYFYNSFTAGRLTVPLTHKAGRVELTASAPGLASSRPARIVVEDPVALAAVPVPDDPFAGARGQGATSGSPSAAPSTSPADDDRALAAIYYQQALRDAARAESTGEWEPLRSAGIAAEAATELQPDRADYWVLLGHVYRQLPGSVSHAMAEDAFARAVTLDPRHLAARLALGQEKFDDGFYASALEQFEAIARQSPRTIEPALVATMNIAYLQDRQLARAVAFWRECLGAAPEVDSVRIALAIVLSEQKDVTAARTELGKVADRSGASAANREYARTLLQAWARQGGR